MDQGVERLQLKVELRPHRGTKKTDLGLIPVVLQQWMVFASSIEEPQPVFIGYLPKPKGAPFLPYTTWTPYPDELKTALMEKISEAAGDPRPLGIEPQLPIAWEKVEGEQVETDDEDETEGDE